MQLDGPVADVAAAGERDAGPSAPGEQRSEDTKAGPHAPHQFVVGNVRLFVNNFEGQGILGITTNLRAERLQEERQRVDVDQARDATQDRFAFRGECRGHQREARSSLRR